jgi:hypothetical protein
MCRDVLGVCLRFAVPGRCPVAPKATREFSFYTAEGSGSVGGLCLGIPNEGI